MRASNSITQAVENKPTFSAAITGNALQNLIKKSVPDARSAARFTGTLISVVAATPALQECNPATVVACALRGEGAGLQIGRDYHVVPFGKTATYILGYKGMLTLLMATGEVLDANCIAVYEGELIGRNKRTKRPEFDFSVYKTEEEELQHPVIGYYFYVELLNGTFRFEYMSVEEILRHAERFSKSFDRQKYDDMMDGKITGDDLEKLKQKSPWYGNTETMMKKTVIRSLLNSGYVRISNDAGLREAMQNDTSYDDGIIPDVIIDSAAHNDSETSDAKSEPVAEYVGQDVKDDSSAGKSRRAERNNATESTPDNKEVMDSFFGDQ